MVIKLFTLLFMVAFYICYFAKMISQRKKGIQTDQLGKGKKGFVKFIEIALKITTYIIPIIQLGSIFFYEGNIHISLRIVGILITATGIFVFIASVLQMKDNWRAGVQREEKTNLVTTVFAVLLFHLQIVNVEEEFLKEAFGAEYLQYNKKVCRYFGRR